MEFTLFLSWKDITLEYEHLLEHAVRQAELPGFRKGKAPRKTVEDKLDKNEVYAKAVEKLLPNAYAKAIKEHGIKPIIQPRIKLQKSGLNENWEFSIVTCEAPEIKLPADYIKQLTMQDKDKRFMWLDSQINVVIPDILAQEEANHRLGALVENFTKLGLTTEQYLASKKMTPETLKAEALTQARRDLKMEFILESIRVDKKLKDRKNTLDFLMGLV